MFLFPIFAAAAAISAQSAPAAESVDPGSIPAEYFERPTPPRGEIAGLFRGDDYPAEAIISNEQGTTQVVLLLDEFGRVTDCSIGASSGSAVLDSKTCEVVAARGRFEPARDKDGRAIASAIRQRVTWKMMETPKLVEKPAVPPILVNMEEVFTQEAYPALAILKEEEGRAVAGVIVNEEGRVVHCRILESSDSAALDAQTCRLLSTEAKFEAARDAEGEPVLAPVLQPITWLLAGEQIVNPSTAWTERVVTRYAPTGTPIGCAIELVGIDVESEEDLKCEVEDLGTEPSVPAVGGLPSVISSAIHESRFFPGGADKVELTNTNPGEKLVMRRFGQLTIGTDGRVTDCREMDWDGLVEPPPGACDLVPGLFEPFRGTDGEPVTGTGTMVFSIYVGSEVIS